MRKIIDYKVIEESNNLTLGNRVNDHIREGYDLYGPPAISLRGQHSHVIIQAVVLYEEETVPNVPVPAPPANHFEDEDFRA